MQLVAHVLDGHPFDIRPAPHDRAWMDASDRRFAYRCLPLAIANGHGWELGSPAAFDACWDGGTGPEAMRIDGAPGIPPAAVSHFGHGILTFHVPCLFETSPGVDLFVTGPINRPKDGVYALTGVVETDWAPYTFTMNWLFTRRDTRVHFDAGEPFCCIFPVVRGALEAITPRLQPLSATPELADRHQAWSDGRRVFNATLSRQQGSPWQKDYFRGLLPGGEASGADDHRSRLRLQPFSDRFPAA